MLLCFSWNINMCVTERQNTTNRNLNIACRFLKETPLCWIWCYLCTIFTGRHGEQLVILVFFPAALCSAFQVLGGVLHILHNNSCHVEMCVVSWPTFTSAICYCHKQVWHTGIKITCRLLQPGLLMSVSACEAFQQQHELRDDSWRMHRLHQEPRNSEKSAAKWEGRQLEEQTHIQRWWERIKAKWMKKIQKWCVCWIHLLLFLWDFLKIRNIKNITRLIPFSTYWNLLNTYISVCLRTVCPLMI